MRRLLIVQQREAAQQSLLPNFLTCAPGSPGKNRKICLLSGPVMHRINFASPVWPTDRPRKHPDKSVLLVRRRIADMDPKATTGSVFSTELHSTQADQCPPWLLKAISGPR